MRSGTLPVPPGRRRVDASGRTVDIGRACVRPGQPSLIVTAADRQESPRDEKADGCRGDEQPDGHHPEYRKRQQAQPDDPHDDSVPRPGGVAADDGDTEEYHRPEEERRIRVLGAQQVVDPEVVPDSLEPPVVAVSYRPKGPNRRNSPARRPRTVPSTPTADPFVPATRDSKFVFIPR